MPFVDLRRHTQVVAIDRGTGCDENLGSVRSSQLDGSWGWREVRRIDQRETRDAGMQTVDLDGGDVTYRVTGHRLR